MNHELGTHQAREECAIERSSRGHLYTALQDRALFRMQAEALVQVHSLWLVLVASRAPTVEAVLQALRATVVSDRDDTLVLGDHAPNAGLEWSTSVSCS